MKTCLILINYVLIFLYGCSTANLENTPKTRANYNIALNQSDKEQFLLNIVRLHYDKSPFFINVDNITTSTTLKTSSGSDDTKLYNSTSSRPFPTLGAFWALQPSIEFTQTPTITYTPLQGTSYISALLTPIDTIKLFYLLETNISLEAVFKLGIDQIGQLNNDEVWHTESSINTNRNEFNQLISHLDKYRIEHKLNLYLANYNNEQILLLIINNNDAAATIAKMLNLNKPYHKIILSQLASEENSKNVVRIKTRSFFAILNFLAKGVVADPLDNKKSEISNNLKTGKPDNNIDHLTDGLFKIYYTAEHVPNSHNKVLYEKKWYYIANSDIISKATLLLVKLLYSLQIGEITENTWPNINLAPGGD